MWRQRQRIRRNRPNAPWAACVGTLVPGHVTKRTQFRRDGLVWGEARCESLEERLPLAQIDIQFDYTYDTTGFFNDPARRELLDLAATTYENRFTDALAAIVPGGGNTWSAVIDSPSELEPGDSSRRKSVTIQNPTIGAGVIRIYVGAIDFGASRLAEGGPGGYNANGSSVWLDLVQSRGQSGALSTPAKDVGLWGGSISFSSDANWDFSLDSTIAPGKTDFVTVAIHELGHALGFGTLSPFTSKIVSNKFTGSEATRVNGGTQPSATTDGGHWATGTTSDGQQAILVPTIPAAKRLFVTSLDWAALQDMGWETGNRMYRLFNPNANFHFFTTDKAEFDALVAIGLQDETTSQNGFSVAPNGAEGAFPLFRMYNPNKGSHYYTTNVNERDFLTTRGWNAEGAVGNVFSTQVPGTTELFRLYNNDSGVHLFTTDVNVKNGTLAAFPGIWVQHDSVGFAFNALARDAAGTPSSASAIQASPALAAAAFEATVVTVLPSSFGVYVGSANVANSGLVAVSISPATPIRSLTVSETDSVRSVLTAREIATTTAENPVDDLFAGWEFETSLL